MCSLKESMRGVCRHCPTKTEAPAPPLDLNTTKENNQLSEKTFRRRERRLWNGILRECVLTYKGEKRDSNIYSFPYFLFYSISVTKSISSRHFIHLFCIFIHFRVLRILRLSHAPARLNPAYRTQGTEPLVTLRVVRLDPHSDSLTAPLRL